MTGAGSPGRDAFTAEWTVGGVSPAALADRYGTPIYVYDLGAIAERAALLRAAMSEVVDLAFAVKANPSLAVVATLGAAGFGADVASGAELALALRAGIRPDQIVVTGPGKRDQELRAAVEAGVRAVTVESPGELARLERIAAAVGRRQPILLRRSIAPANTEPGAGAPGERGSAGAPSIGAGAPSEQGSAGGPGIGAATRGFIAIGGARGRGAQFGMGLADLRAAYQRAADSPHLDPLGIHAFGASNVRDVGVLAGQISRSVAVARREAAAAGVPLRVVDCGGGLGIPYADDEGPLDTRALGIAIRRLLARDARRHPTAPRLRLLLEPGRFLVGPAGVYLASVIDVKAGRGETIAVLDGGIHHLLRPALVGADHRVTIVPGGAPAGSPRDVPHGLVGDVPHGLVVALPRGPASDGPSGPPAARATKRGRVTLAGPLCTGLDVLASLDRAPTPRPGDLVVVHDAGAYGFTESMPFFLSHPTPAEVVVRAGQSALARPRLDPASWARDQRLPVWANVHSEALPTGPDPMQTIEVLATHAAEDSSER